MQKNRTRYTLSRLLTILVFILVFAGLAFVLFYPGRAVVKGARLFPVPLHSALIADYSADPREFSLAPAATSLIADALRDHTTDDSIDDLIDDLLTLVPTVTAQFPTTPQPTATALPSQSPSQTASPGPTLAQTATPTATLTSTLPGVTATHRNPTRPAITATHHTPTRTATSYVPPANTPTQPVQPTQPTRTPTATSVSPTVTATILTPTRTSTPTLRPTSTQRPYPPPATAYP